MPLPLVGMQEINAQPQLNPLLLRTHKAVLLTAAYTLPCITLEVEVADMVAAIVVAPPTVQKTDDDGPL